MQQEDNGSREHTMANHVDVITLAVSDLHRSLDFYRQLGFESPGIIGSEFEGDDDQPAGAVVMFELRGGLTLALYPRSELAKDSHLADRTEPGPGEFSLGHLVSTRGEVDEILRLAEDAGATTTGPPHDRPWGIYSGYFQDPDGHLWEVIWNPGASSDA